MKRINRAVVAGAMVGMWASAACAQTCQPMRAPAASVPNFPGSVNVIASYDDGSTAGRAFYVGGSSSTLGGVARLTSSGWAAPGGTPLAGAVNVISEIPDGSGPGGRAGLYVGGTFPGFLARWDGAAWQRVTPAPNGAVYAISSLPDAEGHEVLHIVVGQSSASLQRLENGAWRILGVISGSGRWNERVVTFDEDGPGDRPRAIYMASGVNTVSDSTVSPSVLIGVQSGIVRWDGQHFTALPLAGNMGNWIKSMAVYDDGVHGPSMYVAGHGTPPAGPIMRWDTVTQTFVTPVPLTGVNQGDTAYGMAVLKDGLGVTPDRTRMYGMGGGASYIGVSSPAAPSVALNGAAWQPVTFTPSGLQSAYNYHFPTGSGELGAGHIPAILSSVFPSSTSTPFFAIIGCPRCAADLDLDGQATVGDIFMYLEAFFSGGTLADTNRSGTITLQDLFDYLGSYFAGCS